MIPENKARQTDPSLTDVFNGSVMRDLALILSQNEAWRDLKGKSEPENRARWHADEFIKQVMPRSRLWGSRLFDQVLPEQLRQKMYDPFYSDHDVNHSFRVNQNSEVGLVCDPEVRSLNYKDRIDTAISLGAANPLHDCLQVDSIMPEKKRLGHDQIGGRFLTPGLMLLGNLMGLTNYSERQMALAAYEVANHELERKPMVITDFADPAKLVKQYETQFGQSLAKTYPGLGEIRDKLADFDVDLFKLELDFSHIDLKFAELGRRQLTAADVRDQVAPPSWAALRAIKAIPGRQYVDWSQSIEDYQQLIDKVVQGYNPNPSEFKDDTLRAVYETCRSFGTSDLSPFSKAWLKYSQLRRGDYHYQFAQDLIMIGQRGDLTATTLFKKHLELAQELEAEVWEEHSQRTNELTDALNLISTRDLSGELSIDLTNPYLAVIGGYVLRQFSCLAVHLRRKYELMSQQSGFDANDFLTRVETVMEYAKNKCSLYAAMVPREILALKMRKLVVSYSEF